MKRTNERSPSKGRKEIMYLGNSKTSAYRVQREVILAAIEEEKMR